MIKKVVAAVVLVSLLTVAIVQAMDKKTETPETTNQTTASKEGLSIGAKAPDFELKTLTGENIKLSSLKGKKVMLNFWATWCTYCVKEMPALQAQWEKWRDQGVVILGINTGEDEMTVRNFTGQMGVDFPVLFDRDNEAVQKYGVVPMPTTFFVDKKGRISSIHQGELNLESLDDQIRQLVNP